MAPNNEILLDCYIYMESENKSDLMLFVESVFITIAVMLSSPVSWEALLIKQKIYLMHFKIQKDLYYG